MNQSTACCVPFFIIYFYLPTSPRWLYSKRENLAGNEKNYWILLEYIGYQATDRILENKALMVLLTCVKLGANFWKCRQKRVVQLMIASLRHLKSKCFVQYIWTVQYASNYMNFGWLLRLFTTHKYKSITLKVSGQGHVCYSGPHRPGKSSLFCFTVHYFDLFT